VSLVDVERIPCDLTQWNLSKEGIQEGNKEGQRKGRHR
jgi:hypothetical protein